MDSVKFDALDREVHRLRGLLKQRRRDMKTAVVQARVDTLHEAEALVRKYLSYNSQREVSYNEVQDCCKAILALTGARS